MSSLENKIFPFNAILSWYGKNGRHYLPWRQIYHLPIKDRLYRVWIAEVMLQQTQVDRVMSYYARFLEKYPTVESLASTTYEELFPYWQGLGYYSRARGTIELAKIIVEKYSGIFPDDFEKLRKLPGVGIYTAQALLAFGYNQSILAVDVNLEKIFARYYFGAKLQKIQKAKSKKQKGGIVDFDILISALQSQFERDVEEAVSLSARDSSLGTLSGRDINNALMDFGAYTGKLSPENLKEYPLKNCLWLQTKGTLEISTKNKNQEISPLKHLNTQSLKHSRYTCSVFLHENHKKYWSSLTTHYEPFLVEPTNQDDRASIQDYFSATYGLEVSVRPSFGSGIFIPEFGCLNPGITQTIKLFHAQIQTGKLSLPVFSKTDKNDWVTQNILPNK